MPRAISGCPAVRELRMPGTSKHRRSYGGSSLQILDFVARCRQAQEIATVQFKGGLNATPF